MIMKQILLVIFLFVNIFCFGQDIYFDSKQGNKMFFCIDNEKVSYTKMFDEINLYKSSHKKYPYVFTNYDSSYKDTLYYLIKSEEINIYGNRISIKIHNDENKGHKRGVYILRNRIELSFKYNSD